MKTQKISVSSCFDYDVAFAEQIRLAAKTGFSHISVGSHTDHSGIYQPGGLEKIQTALKTCGIKIDTIHFPQNLNTDNWQPVMEKTMEAAKLLECPVIVAHCTSFMLREEKYAENFEKLKAVIPKLEALCEKYQIRVALENLCPGPATEIVEELLKIANPEWIGFCYDSSHDQIDGPRPMELLKRQKDRLFAVHISDRIKEFTDHVTPGEGFIDFSEMTDILRDAKIEFPFLMEVMKTYSQYKDTEELLQATYRTAKVLAEKVS